MTVRRMRIGDVLTLARRSVNVGLEENYREIGVRSFGKGLFLKEPTSGADLGNKRVFHVEQGDLVVSNIFGWEGAVAVADERHVGTIGSHRFMTWTANGGAHVPYLAHYFVSDAGLRQIGDASPGSAGRNRTLSIKNFEKLTIPLPDIAEQRRIADHLDAVAHASSRPHPDRNYLRRLKQRVIDTVAGHPEQLAKLLSPRDSVPVAGTDSYRITGVYSFGKGLLDRGPILGADTKYKTLTRLHEHDLVYSKLGAFEGAVAVVPSSFAGTFVSPEFPVFNVNRQLSPRYLHHVVSSPLFEDLLSASTVGVGARQKRVSPAIFLTLPITLPSPQEQRRINGVLDRFDASWEIIERSTQLTHSLLPAARNEVFNSLR